jgi:hypothetical protein
MSTSKTSSWFTNLLVVVASIAAAVTSLEAGGIVYEFFKAPVSVKQFRLAQPPPYQNAPYFSRAFIEESFHQPDGWKSSPATRMLIPSDYAGTHFNVRDGRRVTPGNPLNPRLTVRIFGGSTVYCGEVPDNLTLPSQLQTVINRVGGQVDRLRATPLSEGDVVIFYDGVNDIFQGLYVGALDHTISYHNEVTRASLPAWNRLLLNLAEHSAFTRVFLNPIGEDRVPFHLQDEARRADLRKALEKHYQSELLAAHDYVQQQGATFYHFLQPNLFNQSYRTRYEEQILRNPRLFAPPGMALGFDEGYPQLAKVSALFRHQYGVGGAELLDVLLPRPSTETEYFLDSCHVNHEGNRIVAEAIARTINDGLGKP